MSLPLLVWTSMVKFLGIHLYYILYVFLVPYAYGYYIDPNCLEL